ncbi:MULTISPECIES: hypothetical protein [Haloarcula]|uniref:Uncharacterized protein n=2 Tax=Haloarcula sebkhae TaxID=932660 RepID=A0ACC6VSF5_9EURY|nr:MULTISPECIES: hypothetical protein [Haloarcula]
MTKRSFCSIVLAALVVISISSLAITAGGEETQPQELATAETPAMQTVDFEASAPRGQWNSATGTGEIILDNESYYSVFQGERDIETWRDTDGNDVSGTVLEGNAGQAEGEIIDLSSSIPADQATGQYSGNDLTLRVRQPRITDVTLYNSVGTELDNASELQEDESMLVVVDWNYVQAEDIQVDLINRETDITIEREVLSTTPTRAQADRLPMGLNNATLASEAQGTQTTNRSTAYWLLDFNDIASGTYTLRIDGSDDLTTDEATRTIRINVEADSAQAPTATPLPTPTAAPPTATPTEALPTSTATSTPTPTAPTPTSQPTVETLPATNTPTTTGQETSTSGATGPGFGVLTTFVSLISMLLYALAVVNRQT